MKNYQEFEDEDNLNKNGKTQQLSGLYTLEYKQHIAELEEMRGISSENDYETAPDDFEGLEDYGSNGL